MRAFYFGCTNGIGRNTGAGHGLYDSGLRLVYDRATLATIPFDDHKLDGTFVKIGAVEGVASLVHPAEGWTYVDIVDSSGDARGGSHSGFLFDATLDYDTALAEARKTFPQVFARMEARFTITDSQPRTETPGEGE